ncbi:MAG TPA: acetate--CoA ligase family protein [Methanomassiliicoccales archaeon]|nr:acetate--CoA ligase family protein [Methanomassiliicoccales archaeon]HQM66828.1 acetate--CoA ligase family protein [Methanomassiliicoccales archaeon]
MRELFEPASVAIIGASPDRTKVGNIILGNMIESGFQGPLYPVNPRYEEIMGLRCYPRVTDVPGPVEMAVIVVPAKAVLQVTEECGQKGVGAIVVISAGFKEVGLEGAVLERRLGELAHRYGMRVLGPNCLGLVNTHHRMNATFAREGPREGNIAISSQSGAICVVILDWAANINIGFSKFVSVGNKLDVDEGHLLEYLREDPFTKVIGMYIEGTDRGREFLRQAELTTRVKPVIALKAGRTSSGAKAASSHTGAMSGSDRVYDAAMRQAGVVRVGNIEEMFDLLQAFSTMPLPQGEGVAIVTNAGGLGVMAADACSDNGLTLASFEPATVERLREGLPPAASLYNPIDVVGDADAARYDHAIRTVMADPNVACVVALLAPTDLVDVSSVARTLTAFAGASPKPIVTSFVGGKEMLASIEMLKAAGVPNYPSPERGVRALAAMVEHRRNLEREEHQAVTPVEADHAAVREVIAEVRAEGRLQLSESEGKRILRAYGIATPEEGIAKDLPSALALAERIGYPVAMKVESPDIAHKTDIGGVVLDIDGPEELERSYQVMLSRVHEKLPRARMTGVSIQRMVRGREVIVGMVRDDQFGPVVTFGLGGIFVEILRDVAHGIAPLDRNDAERMVRSIKAYPMLTGARGKRPGDIPALVDVILRVSQMAMEFPELEELEMNPVMVGDEGMGVTAVDALVTIKGEQQ